MATATQIAASMPGWAPDTKQYSTSDGKYLAVEAPPIPAGPVIPGDAAVVMLGPGRQAVKWIPRPTVVFLCSAGGAPIDADENDYDPLTPLHTFPAGTTHEDALTQAGYELEN